jgi:Uncharacterized conserved protein
MKVYAYTIDLKKDPVLIAQYVEYHRKVWPEVLENLKNRGILSDRIFILGTRLFMLIEANDDFDLQSDMQKCVEGSKEEEWEKLMRKFQVPVEWAGNGEWWAQMELVFDLNR